MNLVDGPNAARRPLKTRNARWAGALAASLARAGVSPNAISLASIGFAAVAAGAFVGTMHATARFADAGLYLLAIVGIQGRLLCNMLDGMVAVEGGKRTPTGELFNEVPDRVGDTLILVAAGYAADPTYGPTLGWAAALLAMFTAYVRATGRAAGAGSYFLGPMAKPHRMAALTFVCAIGALGELTSREPDLAQDLNGRVIDIRALRQHQAGEGLSFCLALICVGCLITVVRRLSRISADLRANFTRGS